MVASVQLGAFAAGVAEQLCLLKCKFPLGAVTVAGCRAAGELGGLLSGREKACGRTSPTAPSARDGDKRGAGHGSDARR